MEPILYYIRDHLTGTHYFIYAFVLLFLMFAIIGYLFKQKYGKLDIKLATSQSMVDSSSKKEVQSNGTNQSVSKIIPKTEPLKNPEGKATSILTNANSTLNKPKVEPTLEIKTVVTPQIITPTPQPNPITREVPKPQPMPNPTTNPSPVLKPLENSTVTTSGPIPEIK